MSKKVLVVMGGFSAEREVSLVTGKGVYEALKKKGYDAIAYDLTNTFDFVDVLKKEKPDVVFNALHGNWGEDGEIQGFLDMMQIPYTHSGLKASALGMDKDITKRICRSGGIKVPVGETITYKKFRENGTLISFPYVVKPVSDGSSVGVFIIHSEKDLNAVHYDDENREILVEKFIEGKEITVTVLNDKALTVTELRPKVEFYNYEAKYTDGLTEHIIPAEIPESAFNAAMRYSEKLHKILGCNTISRCDLRYNDRDGVVLLEINTNPGMTPLSLVPEQFKYLGGSYEELCSILVENAKCRKKE
jgi:D-alanine-D-alanine ligase